jgi:hypothetical protein
LTNQTRGRYRGVVVEKKESGTGRVRGREGNARKSAERIRRIVAIILDVAGEPGERREGRETDSSGKGTGGPSGGREGGSAEGFRYRHLMPWLEIN